MLEARNIKTKGEAVVFDLFIESNHSSIPDVIVEFFPSSKEIRTDKELDYAKKDYVEKAVRKLCSYAPEYPESFRMVWY